MVLPGVTCGISTAGDAKALRTKEASFVADVSLDFGLTLEKLCRTL